MKTDHLSETDARAVDALTDPYQLHLSPRHWVREDDR